MRGDFIVEGPVLLPGGTVRRARVTASGERLTAITPPRGGQSGSIHLAPGHVLIPGLVDLHMHGGQGVDAATASGDAWFTLSRHAASCGATTVVPALVSSDQQETLDFLEGARLIPDDPGGARIPGVHLEGPFLSPRRRGAHCPGSLRDPGLPEVRRWLAAARGRICMVTLAPELPGSAAVIEVLYRAGVVVAAGHTDASFSVMMRAFDAGVRHVVHLFNAMAPIHHRDPGPAVATLLRSGVTCELIPDGEHLDAKMIELVLRCKAAREICLVTDSIAAAGLGDGSYTLGPMSVEVEGGRARCPDGRLAGSTLTPAMALRAAGQELGWSLGRAVSALSTVPARILGRQAGEIAPGRRADLVVLDGDWNPVATIVGGRLVHGYIPEGG